MTFQQFAYRNVFRNFRNYAAFFMASFSSVFVFFIYSMIMFHPEIENGFLGDLSIVGMIVAEIILVLFSWFFIFYSMRAFLEVRSKEFAILLHLGMERRQLGQLVFLETTMIGLLSCISGIGFGFAFSKFFFMIVREILKMDQLSLYISWEPFLLTFSVFMSAFMFMSIGSIMAMKEVHVHNLLTEKRSYMRTNTSFKKAIAGPVLIGIGYVLALITTRTTLFTFTLFIPLLVTFGTFYFFTDTIFFLLEQMRKRKSFYWNKSRLLSFAEQMFMFRQNAKMFFIVTMVSTLAFLSVVSFAALSSFTAQYGKLNPLGIVYKGYLDNPYEKAHIELILDDLEKHGLSYHMTRFVVLKQTSSQTLNEVEVLSERDVNQLLYSYGYPLIRLNSGEAMFIPYSEESIRQLRHKRVETILVENDVHITIQSVYPEILFSSSIVSKNAIVVSDEDFAKLQKPFSNIDEVPGYHLYAFDIPQWSEAKDVGTDIQNLVTREYVESETYSLPFYFENTGLNYYYISAMYSLFTFLGLLVVAVFLLAAGSFVYFKLYANLDREKRQFAVLARMGLTEQEQKRLITRYLLPQFFLPWGVAVVHALFAFIALQSILKDVMNLIIVKETIIIFSVFVILQIVYFYVIRWRYIVHVRN